MFELNRRILWREVDLKLLPLEMEGTLSLLKKENNFYIKGGYAKTILEIILIQDKKLKDNRAFGENNEFNSKTMDIDIVLSYFGKRRHNIEELSCRISDLQEKLAEIEIVLKPDDIEIRREKSEILEFIREFLETRDLTINEAILFPVSGKWKIFFTDKCYRDTINGAAIPAPNGTGIIRIDYNRMIATPYAMARMIRSLTDKKVKAVYIPQWWIDRNNKEAERLGKESLGAYALIIMQRYLGKPELQRRFMRAMYELKITDFKNFNDFYKEQLLFFKLRNGNGFEFNKNRSFEEIQRDLLKKEEQGKNGRAQRRKERGQCPHSKIEEFECAICDKHCTIRRCEECTATEVMPQGKKTPVDIAHMLCNYNTIHANIYHNQKGFYPFYPE